MTRRTIFAIIRLSVFTIWLLILLPITLLEIGFSSGGILSASKMIEDLSTANPLIIYSILAWATVLYGVYLVILIVRKLAER